MKKTGVLLLPVLLICLLTGCGKVETKAVIGGTTVRVEGKNSGILSRLPRFEKAEDRILMKMNGRVCYSACILTEERLKNELGDRVPMAESTNILVYKYRHEHPDFFDVIGYRYVMKLNGAEGAYVCFDSDDPPETGGYGNDFTTCMRVEAGGIETVPDTDFALR